MSSIPGLYPDKVNLNNCDREPIHIIGMAQAHGVILACNKNTLEITQVSENSKAILGQDISSLLGKSMSLLLPDEHLKDLVMVGEEKKLLPVLKIRKRSFLAIAHLSKDSIILDIEPAGDNLNPVQIQEQLSKILNDLNAADTFSEIGKRAVDLVRYLYDYDRVMLYRFDEEWNGEVVAEQKEGHLESWLGLHYPATDIPKPSRDLFLKQGVRIIQDVNYTPAPLIPQISPINDKPLDLSRSELRGVSPIHIEYLKNMKVGASLTAAIVLKGKLWGLLACHHYSSKFVNYHQRQFVKLLTQVLSNRLAVISSAIYKERSGEAKITKDHIIAKMRQLQDMGNALTSGEPSLTDVVKSSGGAFFYEGKLNLIGKTPLEEEIKELIFSFLIKQKNFFHTQNLEKLFPAASKYRKTASGVLSVKIGEEKNDFLIWFRQETAQTVNWGGKPQKIETRKDGMAVLHPRKSFEKWTQKVSGVALPWQEYELEAAIAFRESLTTLILEQQQKEIKALNQELKFVNKELEAFSYSVSHDLRAPLRGIQGFATILKEDFAEKLEEEGVKALNIISQSAANMNELIEDLLLYSRLGEEPVPQSPVDLNDLLSKILSSINIKEEFPRTIVQVQENLPGVNGNKRLLHQLFSNLISNALKYSEKKENPLVEIGWYKDSVGKNIFYIKDNGIGFDPKFREKIFKVFTRFVGNQYPGTGIGLAIVRKVVDKHKGEIWVESSPGEGTVFYFTIQTVNEAVDKKESTYI